MATGVAEESDHERLVEADDLLNDEPPLPPAGSVVHIRRNTRRKLYVDKEPAPAAMRVTTVERGADSATSRLPVGAAWTILIT